jgi:hypothetical protein
MFVLNMVEPGSKACNCSLVTLGGRPAPVGCGLAAATGFCAAEELATTSADEAGVGPYAAAREACPLGWAVALGVASLVWLTAAAAGGTPGAGPGGAASLVWLAAAAAAAGGVPGNAPGSEAAFALAFGLAAGARRCSALRFFCASSLFAGGVASRTKSTRWI